MRCDLALSRSQAGNSNVSEACLELFWKRDCGVSLRCAIVRAFGAGSVQRIEPAFHSATLWAVLDRRQIICQLILARGRVVVSQGVDSECRRAVTLVSQAC